MGSSASSQSKSIRQNMAWYSAGSITYLACQWMLSVVVVRLSSGFDDAGVLALAMAIGNIFTPLAYYNTRTYQVSDVEEEYADSQYVAFRIITTFFAFCLCSIYAALSVGGPLLPVLSFLVYKAVVVIVDILHGVDQRYARLDYAGASLIMQGISSLGAFSLVLVLTNSLMAAIWGMTATAVLILVLFDIRKARLLSDIRPRIKFVSARQLAITCFPAVASGVLCSAVVTVARQFLFVMEGEAALGAYASVATLAAIVQMGASYVYNPLLGLFAEYVHNKEKAKIVSLICKVCVAIVFITMAVSLLFALFGEFGLALLFGPDIVQYVYLLQPMLLCTALTAYIWFFMDLLIVMRSMLGILVANVVAFASVFPFSYWCISNYGANGVSFAGALSYAVGCAVLVFCTVRFLRKEMGENE